MKTRKRTVGLTSSISLQIGQLTSSLNIKTWGARAASNPIQIITVISETDENKKKLTQIILQLIYRLKLEGTLVK